MVSGNGIRMGGNRMGMGRKSDVGPLIYQLLGSHHKMVGI